MVNLQLMGIQKVGVPLPSDIVEEPVFVNAKQYHGILRHWQSRAEAESEKKITRNQKKLLIWRMNIQYMGIDNCKESNGGMNEEGQLLDDLDVEEDGDMMKTCLVD